ncbi:N-acetyl-1-D-myo-inositol-2-amino-2-deoxy-alpha-D-glucopyranoside deacetylase [Lapillicoccus jejuensis]|uniref:N-acetyl-1-D-myo-inositol-2-amino-2-deoxy-alpha-D-glucopyranoside deacetylase n=1 Tax=Lapillicoccus jejuensis TaxID=402171 RepID=A0A542DWA8_9MICO|nr:N-acetyl-1-D-myo-inositol-2-amino-2-deoxy-alpha-D-glucopyranoside deacetylase [Lapillicoccus jejuensis]TQJ07382.1 N-acetyl-1-D-myo-inositol-2-amino-2-deoxy-alpha-D-glucopyranoside deacetylase [Lapillicoccus jejuensis]
MSRLLLVHAHPDDETLTCGVTMAHHVARGDEVHVLTCTLGEEGEVVPRHLAHLQGAPGDPLGPYRRGELARALAVLGVTSHVLGEDDRGATSRWRDSGMAGTSAADHPQAFAAAPLREAATAVARVVARLRPDVLVTYDAGGGYGHPDHVRTHEATRTAVLGLPARDRPSRVFEIRTPRSWAQEDRAWLRERVHPGRHGEPPGRTLQLLDDAAPYPVGVVDDAMVTHEVVDPTAVARQAAALREHVTQLTVLQTLPGDGPVVPFYALSNDVAARLPGREGFARVDPATWAPWPLDPARSEGHRWGRLTG